MHVGRGPDRSIEKNNNPHASKDSVGACLGTLCHLRGFCLGRKLDGLKLLEEKNGTALSRVRLGTALSKVRLVDSWGKFGEKHVCIYIYIYIIYIYACTIYINIYNIYTQ